MNLTFNKIVLLAPQEIKEYLNRCANTKQSPDWHPEGDVLKHTKIVFERARKTGDMDLILSALFHDLGKADVTKPSVKRSGAWSAYGHEYVSADLVEKHKKWISEMGANWKNVFYIVKEHMRVKKINEMRPQKQEELRNNPLFNKFLQFAEFDDMSTLSNEELRYINKS